MLLSDVRRRDPHALWRARPGVPYDGIFWDQGCREIILSARVYRRYACATSRGKFYYCPPLLLISWVRTGYPCWTVWPMSHLRSATMYYLLVHPSVRPPIQLQHTDKHTESSRHYPLPKSQYTPLFRNPSRRELAINGTHNNFPPITSYLLISARKLALVPRNLGRSIH